MATESATPQGEEAARKRSLPKVPTAGRSIGFIIGIIALVFAALYPIFYEKQLGEMSLPIIREWPSVSTGVIMIVFIMMAAVSLPGAACLEHSRPTLARCPAGACEH